MKKVRSIDSVALAFAAIGLLSLGACHSQSQPNGPPGAPQTGPLPGGFATPDGDNSSPRATWDLQLKAIADNSEAHFAETLTPPARMHLDSKVFADCVERYKASPLQADWEHVEKGTKHNHNTAKVHVGEQVIGYHELQSGRWFGDTIWCTPNQRP